MLSINLKACSHTRMKKWMLRVLILTFLIGGIGLYRLGELNKTPIEVENFSTYNLMEIYVLGLIMSVLGYALYPEVAIEHLSLYTPEKQAKKSDFFMKSKVVQEAISNYNGPTKLTWNNSVYMIGHPEARVALALNGATLLKKGKEILIEVPIEYPKNAIAPLLPGLHVQEGLFWVLQQKGWYHTGVMTWSHTLP